MLTGCLNYSSQGYPRLPGLSLQALLNQDDASWTWDQSKTFSSLKLTLWSLVNAGYNILMLLKRPSYKLTHEGWILGRTPKRQSPCEQNWHRPDKELLTIICIWIFRRSTSYVYGRPVDVQTDHNPLVSIV